MLKTLDLDMEPGIQLYDAADEISGDVYFPRDRFAVSSMKRFARSFEIFVQAIVHAPGLLPPEQVL